MLLAGAGLTWLALWHDHRWDIVGAMLLIGLGIPFTFAAMAKLIVDSVRPEETGVASGMNTVMRTIGGVLGAQVGAAILSANTIPLTDVPTEAAFSDAFWIAAGAAAVRRRRGALRDAAVPGAGARSRVFVARSAKALRANGSLRRRCGALRPRG